MSGPWALAQVEERPAGEPEVVTRVTHEATGIELIFVLEDGMFPQSWYQAEINAQAEALEIDEIERTIQVLNASLAKYPEKLIKNNLKRVYVLKSLEFFGTSYGGTYTSNAVFLSNKGIKRGYTDSYIEKVFHAEFSSILYNNYVVNFQEESWKSANAEGFEYGSGGMLALKTGKSSESFQNQHNELGFLNQYAQSSIENDFNSFAKNLFYPTKDFWKLTEEWPGLKAKLELIVAFYGKIDEQFDLEFFRGLTGE